MSQVTMYVMSVNTDNYIKNAKLRSFTEVGKCSEGKIYLVQGTKLPYAFGKIVNNTLCVQRWNNVID